MDTSDTLWTPRGKIHLHPAVLCNSKCLPNFCPVWPKACSLMERLDCLILFPALFYPWCCSCWPLPRLTVAFLTSFFPSWPNSIAPSYGKPSWVLPCTPTALWTCSVTVCAGSCCLRSHTCCPSLDVMLPEDRNLVLFYHDCGPCTWHGVCRDGWLSNVCPSLTCGIATGTGRGPHKGWPSCLPPSQPVQEGWRMLAGWLCVI